MKKKRLWIAVGALGLALVFFWFVVFALAARTLLRAFSEKESAAAVEASLCAEDDDNLCVLYFSVNSLNRMVIHFRLPSEQYPLFYVKAKSRDTVSVYSCEADEADAALVRCTGARAPLGETIDLEVYAADGDFLLARGVFLVSAIAIPTPLNLPSQIPAAEETETMEPLIEDGTPLPEPALEVEETPIENVSPAEEIPTPLPDDAPPPDSTPSSP
ncbi:MAG: hypothetical protein LDL50_00200 [Chloroflexi bacterium]|nr:hypothetical protein [Chloroflexota bacterium]MCA2000885.1 hypothetical protein [Chloroflexota bacterium]